MKNRFRTPLLALLFLTLSGTALQASISETDRSVVAVRLLEEIGRAAQSYRSRQQVLSNGTQARAHLKELEENMKILEQDEVRLQAHIAALETQWLALEKRGVDKSHALKADTIRRAQQLMVLNIAREQYVASLAPLTQRLFQNNDQALELAVQRDAMHMTDTVQGAGALLPELLLSMERLTLTRVAQENTKKAIEETNLVVKRADEAINSIKAITRDVHEQVLRLQSVQARIDAQLRTKAERALIEKGLLSARDGAVHTAAPDLLWPVQGPISAGFHNASYLSFFGVPHQGIDIVVPQGTAVQSSAEGIVFLVRDGGELGYTYILIGHRGTIATLYGHLSSSTVAAGERVEAGQQIGLSGGTPGTPGAGPMTTAAHLHFEVIEDGSNVDPLSVLPPR